MKLVRFAAVGAAAAVLAIAPNALAAGRDDPSVGQLFKSGKAASHWVNTDVATDGRAVELSVEESTASAGFSLQHVEGAAPAASPTFDMWADVTGASGGSPRLVVRFSDGGRGELRPLAWTANTWQTVTDGNWDNNGGTCGFHYQTTWSDVVACHAGADVVSAFFVTDSGWLYPDGYTNLVDNVQYRGTTISAPADNASSK
jgi:hypothetical protein